MGVVDEIQHGFGSNAVVGIFQQDFDLWPDGLVADSGENGNGFLAYFRSGMVQETANHGVSGALAFDLEEAESVENLTRIRGKNLFRQQIHSRTVEGERSRLFGIEAMLANGVLQNDDVLLAGDKNGGEPSEDEQYRNPADLLRRPSQLRGEDKNDDSGQAVTQPPDHGINKPFRLEFHPVRQRQREQFDRRSVDGIAKHLIAALEEQSGGHCSPDKQAGGASQNHYWKDEEHGANAEAAQQARGEQQLKQQRQQAGVKIEIAKENRQGVCAHGKLLGKSLELPASESGNERGDADDGSDGPQVRRRKNGEYAVLQILLAGSGNTCGWIHLRIDAKLAALGRDGHESGTNDEKTSHGEQETFGAGGLGDSL